MTGPEHYRKAEEALSILDVERDVEDWDAALLAGHIALAISAAQAHATLALAAATAMSTWTETGMPQPDRMDWWRAASGEPAERERVKNADRAEFATEAAS